MRKAVRKQFEIKTERLYLRTLTKDDIAIVRDFGKDEFKTDKDALKFIRWQSNPGRLLINFYIWMAQTGQCIGRVYIHSKPELDGDVEIGYGISEEYRNQGYATEAAKAVVKFAFEQAGQEVLCAIVKPENTASLRVIEKLGFEPCGMRTVLDDDGRYFDFKYFKRYN